MSNVSNRTVVSLLLAVLVVTVVGTVFSVSKLSTLRSPLSVTGLVTDAGNVTVTIQGTAAMTVSNNSVAWPTGYWNTSCASNYWVLNASNANSLCYLNTTAGPLQNNTGGLGVGLQGAFVVFNSGTTTLTVEASTGKNASTFLCGANGNSDCGVTSCSNCSVRLATNQHEAGSCGAGTAAETEIMPANTNVTVTLCTALDYDTDSNGINVTPTIIGPKDAKQGAKLAQFTFTGTAN